MVLIMEHVWTFRHWGRHVRLCPNFYVGLQIYSSFTLTANNWIDLWKRLKANSTWELGQCDGKKVECCDVLSESPPLEIHCRCKIKQGGTVSSSFLIPPKLSFRPVFYFVLGSLRLERNRSEHNENVLKYEWRNLQVMRIHNYFCFYWNYDRNWITSSFDP